VKQFFVNCKLEWWKKSWLCSENVNNDETNPKTDLIDPHIWLNTFFVQMEAGLMKKVRTVNRSWTPDSYFSIHKPIHRGNVQISQQGGADFLFCPWAQNTPATPLMLLWMNRIMVFSWILSMERMESSVLFYYLISVSIHPSNHPYVNLLGEHCLIVEITYWVAFKLHRNNKFKNNCCCW